MQGNVNPMLNKDIDLVYEWLMVNKLVLTINILSINVVTTEKVE